VSKINVLISNFCATLPAVSKSTDELKTLSYELQVTIGVVRVDMVTTACIPQTRSKALDNNEDF
jgi:hypothetical protein